MEDYVDTSKLSVRKINKDVAKKVIIKHHYTHAASQCRYALGVYSKSEHSFFDSHDELVGVATYGYPVGRLAAQSISEDLENNQVLELTRLFIFDGYGKNIESYFIGQTIKWLQSNTDIKSLISYADPKVGHKGGIYQATNWLYQGDSMRMVDAYSVRLQEDSEWLHSRTVFSKWGSNNVDHLKKKIGKTFWIREEPRKHRYIYFLGSKGERKKLVKSLKHPTLPYPQDTEGLQLEIQQIDV